jgi:hypothetical protein
VVRGGRLDRAQDAGASALGAWIGVTLAMVGRNTAAALGVAFGYLAIVESLLRGFIPKISGSLLSTNLVIFVDGRPARQKTGSPIAVGGRFSRCDDMQSSCSLSRSRCSARATSPETPARRLVTTSPQTQHRSNTSGGGEPQCGDVKLFEAMPPPTSLEDVALLPSLSVAQTAPLRVIAHRQGI